MTEIDDAALVIESWAHNQRDKFHDRLNGTARHGHADLAVAGALLMQWFEECFSELHEEMQKLRMELRQSA